LPINSQEENMADKSTTITKLEISQNPVAYGQGFSVSAHVTPAGPNRVHGDVDFTCDGAALGTARTDSTGVAAIGVPGGLVHPGAHEFGASFRGDGYNAASDAEVVSVMLSPADGEPWPAEDKVEKFKGSAAPAPEPVVEPVPVKEPVKAAPVPPPVAPLSPMEPPIVQPTGATPASPT
jgi:hypothetical protein